MISEVSNRVSAACSALAIASILAWSSGCNTVTDQSRDKYEEPIPWLEDERSEILETVKVGQLPEGVLDAPRLLAFINTRIEDEGLPENFNIVFRLPPRVIHEEFLRRSILTSGYLAGMELLEEVGIVNEDDLRSQIETLNLRQLLWLVTSAYVMSIQFGDQAIMLGYGFTHHNAITPGIANRAE